MGVVERRCEQLIVDATLKAQSPFTNYYADMHNQESSDQENAIRTGRKTPKVLSPTTLRSKATINPPNGSKSRSIRDL